MNLAYIMAAQSMLTVIITINEYLILGVSKNSPFGYLTEIKLNRYHFPQVWWCKLGYVPNLSIDWLEANAHLKNILPCTFILPVGGLGKVCLCFKTNWEACPEQTLSRCLKKKVFETLFKGPLQWGVAEGNEIGLNSEYNKKKWKFIAKE